MGFTRSISPVDILLTEMISHATNLIQTIAGAGENSGSFCDWAMASNISLPAEAKIHVAPVICSEGGSCVARKDEMLINHSGRIDRLDVNSSKIKTVIGGGCDALSIAAQGVFMLGDGSIITFDSSAKNLWRIAPSGESAILYSGEELKGLVTVRKITGYGGNLYLLGTRLNSSSIEEDMILSLPSNRSYPLLRRTPHGFTVYNQYGMATRVGGYETGAPDSGCPCEECPENCALLNEPPEGKCTEQNPCEGFSGNLSPLSRFLMGSCPDNCNTGGSATIGACHCINDYIWNYFEENPLVACAVRTPCSETGLCEIASTGPCTPETATIDCVDDAESTFDFCLQGKCYNLYSACLSTNCVKQYESAGMMIGGACDIYNSFSCQENWLVGVDIYENCS